MTRSRGWPRYKGMRRLKVPRCPHKGCLLSINHHGHHYTGQD